MAKWLVCLFGCIAILLLNSCGKRLNWWEHYRPESKDPYGTWLVANLLQAYFPGEKFEPIKDSLASRLDRQSAPATYMYIGPWFSVDSIEMASLLDFVKRGGHAFIACQQLPYPLLDTLGKYECANFTAYTDSVYLDENYVHDSATVLNFSHPDLRREGGYSYQYWAWQAVGMYSWDYLPPDLFCEGQTVFASLGTLQRDSFINFAKASYGDGAFFFHSTPLAFTNYHLVREDGRDYAATVFSHLPAAPILLDQENLRLERPPRSQGNYSQSPLKYILSQPPLAWAWYTLLGMAFFYLVFRAKRRQRIIPVLERNTNTSLEFISTIGRLYFNQNNHKQLALQKMKLFLGFVRERYHLPTRDLDGHFTKTLAAIAEVPEETLGKILMLHRNIERSGFVSENTLVDFHQLMEQFYKKCK